MALDFRAPLRSRFLPLAMGIATVLVGLCLSSPLRAQVEGAEPVVDSTLPFTETGYGVVGIGATNLQMSYSSPRYGQDNGQFGVGLQNRRLVDGGALLFDVQYDLDFGDNRSMGVNAGGGFRWMVPGLLSGAPRILGVTGWYDGRNTRLKNYFNQVGLSLESLGEQWDFRVNANIIAGKDRQEGDAIPTGDIGYQGFYLSQMTLVPVDQAASVIDFEAAFRVRNRNVWLFAGPYSVHTPGNTDAGFKAGARGYVGDDLQLQLAVTNDDFFGTDVTFGMIWFPGRTKLHGRGACGLENRLREPVLRNDYIAIKRQTTQGAIPLTDTNGDLIRVVHVDSTAAAPGNGSYESPFASLNNVYAGSQAKDIVLVHSGSEFDGESVELRDFQRLLGEGGNETHSVSTSKFGLVDLPETSPGALAGAIPIIHDAPGAAVTLAAGSISHDAATDVSSNEVSNLSIDGGARGIVSPTVGTATASISLVNIANTTGHGIELTPFVETITDTSVKQVRFSPTIGEVTFNNVGGDDIHLDATTSEPSSTTVTESIRITEASSVDGNGRGINIINNKSAATIADYTFDGGTTATGALRFSGSQAGATVSNASIGGGAGVGIDIVDDSKGTFTFTSTTVEDTGGAAFNLNGGTAAVTFTGKITQGANAAAVAVTGHKTGTVTFNEATTDEGVIEATNGTGLRFDDADGVYTFNHAVDLAGGDAGIDIVNDSAGLFTFKKTTITSPTGAAFNLNSGTATVTFTGNITQANNAAAVAIGGEHKTGTVTFNEATTDEGVITATNGTGLQFDNADGTYKFNHAVVLSNTVVGGDAGIDITNDSGGTFTFAKTTITSPTGTAFNLNSGTATVTFTGKITQANNAAAVAIGGEHKTGTVTFNEATTDEGVITATNGTGLQFDNADGTYKFNHAVVLSNTVVGGDAGIDITNDSGGTFTFAKTTITDPTGTAFNLNGGTATVTFTGKITQSNNAAAVAIGGGHKTGTVTFNEATTGAGVVTATAGTGIVLNDADGTYNFSDAVTLSTGAVVNIFGGSTGTVTFDSGSSINNFSGTAFTVTDSAATVTYSGTIGSSILGRPVEISHNTGGIVTFGGAITGAANGIDVHSNSGGTFQFNGLVNLDTANNTAVSLATNSGATIGFNNLDINTTTGTGTGFTATGGGTIRLTGTGNTIATTTGVGLNLNGVEISSTGAAFKSISVDGAANGIVLNNVTGTGTLSVGSGGSSFGDGGTIQNTTADGISITDAAHVSLNNMLVTGAVGSGDGIHLEHTSGSFNVTIADCRINNTAGQGIDIIAGAGTTNVTLDGNEVTNTSSHEAVLLTVNGGTTNFLAENNVLGNDSTSATFHAQANSSSTLNATVNDNKFNNDNARAFEIENNGLATVRLSLLDNKGQSVSESGKPFLLQKNGGSFGVVLLDPQPVSGVTAPNVNQRNDGTGTYDEYVTDNAKWVIEFLPDPIPPHAPISLGFTSLNEGVVPIP
ncbi:MAG: hypothetical protein NTW96_19945 [Planctomycetia bacterium]|nr:hypothetical protein [Planctomycetia bacterium]